MKMPVITPAFAYYRYRYYRYYRDTYRGALL